MEMVTLANKTGKAEAEIPWEVRARALRVASLDLFEEKGDRKGMIRFPFLSIHGSLS